MLFRALRTRFSKLNYFELDMASKKIREKQVHAASVQRTTIKTAQMKQMKRVSRVNLIK